MYYDFLQTNRKRIIRAVILLLVALFLWTTITLIGRIGKVPVTIAVVPSNAAITLNSQTYQDGTVWLPAGTYAVSLSRDGFAAQKQKVVITAEKSENVIAASLVPESDAAKQWAEEHQKDYKDNERYGAKQASANGDYFTTKNPITKQLPFTDPYYKIAYTSGDDNTITLTVTTTSPRYRFYALEKIRQWGYDPTDFVIDFKDFTNPLEKS